MRSPSGKKYIRSRLPLIVVRDSVGLAWRGVRAFNLSKAFFASVAWEFSSVYSLRNSKLSSDFGAHPLSKALFTLEAFSSTIPYGVHFPLAIPSSIQFSPAIPSSVQFPLALKYGFQFPATIPSPVQFPSVPSNVACLTVSAAKASEVIA